MLFGFSTKAQSDGRKQGICRKIKGGTQMPKAQNLCNLSGCAREPVGMGW